MGLMNFIRQNLPESWEKASTEMKMKTELINRLHANVPRQYKNKYHYREGIFEESLDAHVLSIILQKLQIQTWTNGENQMMQLKIMKKHADKEMVFFRI